MCESRSPVLSLGSEEPRREAGPAAMVRSHLSYRACEAQPDPSGSPLLPQAVFYDRFR